MVQTWGTSEPAKRKCSQCGSLYEVRTKRLPVRDQDSADCEVCGAELDSWNSTTYPSFTLVERAPWPKPAAD